MEDTIQIPFNQKDLKTSHTKLNDSKMIKLEKIIIVMIMIYTTFFFLLIKLNSNRNYYYLEETGFKALAKPFIAP